MEEKIWEDSTRAASEERAVLEVISDRGRCIKQLALNAHKNVKFLSNRKKVSRFIARNVTLREGNFSFLLLCLLFFFCFFYFYSNCQSSIPPSHQKAVADNTHRAKCHCGTCNYWIQQKSKKRIKQASSYRNAY